VEASSSPGLQPSTAAKAKENIKTASYGIVIVVGLGVTGVVAYTVFSVSDFNHTLGKADTIYWITFMIWGEKSTETYISKYFLEVTA
jgi:hypothetical protein